MIKKIILLLACFTTFMSTACMAETSNQNGKEEFSERVKYLSLFGDIFEKVKNDYVEEVSDKEIIEYAISGMLSSLDPHSAYLTEKDFDNVKVQTRGKFGGLGIEVTMDKGLVKVVSPIDDTPAAKAGVQPGDYISHIDDEAVMGMSLSEAVSKMRGERGSKIKIKILREGETKPLDIEIIRDIITINPVKSGNYDNVGYIRVTSFSKQTYSSVKEAVENMQKDKNFAGIVLDLRNNPGGLLDQAIMLSDAFLERGEIVSTRGREASDTKRSNARSGDILNGKPIAVLINGGSASASEIVAGALQDHNRAIVMGTKSFGKGSVQTVIPVDDKGAIRLTTSRYYTPSGRSIQAEGIEPDIRVEQAKIEIQKEKFSSEADLPGHLNKEGDSSSIDLQIKNLQTEYEKEKEEKNKETSKQDDETSNNIPKLEKDYQLSRAIDLIKAISIINK